MGLNMKATKRKNDGGFGIDSVGKNRPKDNFPQEFIELWILAVRAGRTDLAQFIEKLRKAETEKSVET